MRTFPKAENIEHTNS